MRPPRGADKKAARPRANEKRAGDFMQCKLYAHTSSSATEMYPPTLIHEPERSSKK
jgi:hypothetical protein